MNCPAQTSAPPTEGGAQDPETDLAANGAQIKRKPRGTKPAGLLHLHVFCRAEKTAAQTVLRHRSPADRRSAERTSAAFAAAPLLLTAMWVRSADGPFATQQTKNDRHATAPAVNCGYSDTSPNNR